MNKLIAVEACRCLAVIQDSIDTLERIMCVTPTLFTLGLDLESLLGRDLTAAMRKYQQTRTQLESLRMELASVKAAGFKARLKSIQRKIETSTDLFQKSVKHLVLLLSGEETFIQKLIDAGVQPSALQPQAGQIGGPGGKSVASGSVAGDTQQSLGHSQTNTLTGQQPQQSYASINDLINILRSLYEVVSIDMCTTADQERQKKTVMSALAASERSSLAQLQSLRREFDITLGQIGAQTDKINLQLTTVNDTLSSNAGSADAESNRLIEDCSAAEIASSENFNQVINSLAPKLNEIQRRLQDVSRKHREQAVELQRSKRRSELQVRNWIKNYDEKCHSLDDTVYRLHHEINISHERIGVLEKKIAEYEEYRAKRNSAFEGHEEEMRLFMLKWELPAVVYETQHKEFA